MAWVGRDLKDHPVPALQLWGLDISDSISDEYYSQNPNHCTKRNGIQKKQKSILMLVD